MRGSVKVAPVSKITEKRLKWYGHVKRRDEGHTLRRMLDAPVPGKRRRRKQKSRWKDSCKRYMESVLNEENAGRMVVFIGFYQQAWHGSNKVAVKCVIVHAA